MNFNFLELCSVFILHWFHMWNLIIHSIVPSMDTEFNSPHVPAGIRISSRIAPISCLKHPVNNLNFQGNGSLVQAARQCWCGWGCSCVWFSSGVLQFPQLAPTQACTPWLFINHRNSLATARRVWEKNYWFPNLFQTLRQPWFQLPLFYHYLSLSSCRSLVWSASVMPIYLVWY